MHKLFLLISFLQIFSGFAQDSLSTLPFHFGTQSSSGVAFNIKAKGSSIVIDSLAIRAYNSPALFEIWYKPVPVYGTQYISPSTGWVWVGNAWLPSASPPYTDSLMTIPLNLNIPVQADQAVGLYIGHPSLTLYSANGGVYPDTVSNEFLHIIMDGSAGLAGNHPVADHMHRHFNGTVYYNTPSSAPYDAGLYNVRPLSKCGSAIPVSVEIGNYGDSLISQVVLDWSVNGIPQSPYTHNGLIDTTGGPGNQSVQLILGNASVSGPGPHSIMVNIASINGISDTAGNNNAAQTNFHKALSGTYYLGGTGADFPDFSSIENVLNHSGVCGPTTVVVNNQAFNEQLFLLMVPGLDSINTLTFQSLGGDSSTCILTSNIDSAFLNYTLRLRDVNNVSFKNLTVQNTSATNNLAIDISRVHHISFDNMVVRNFPPSGGLIHKLIFASDSIFDDLAIRRSVLEGGSTSVYLEGRQASLTGDVTILRNLIRGKSNGIYLKYSRDAEISDNIFSTATSTGPFYTGLEAAFNRDLTIQRNLILDTVSNSGYGIYIVSNNASPGNESVVINNFVSIGSSTNFGSETGIRVLSSFGTLIGNNSIVVRSSSSVSSALGVSCSGPLRLLNNNLQVNGPGSGIFFDCLNLSVVASNYNNIYTPSGNAVSINAGSQYNLSGWQSFSSKDLNSISTDPQFVSYSDLHSCADSLHGKGMALAEVDDDFDGDGRPANPDIGADEFMAPYAQMGADIMVCEGDTVMIGYPASQGTSFFWSNGATTSSIPALFPGTYYVDFSNACGSGSDTINVDIDPLPVALFNHSFSFLTTYFTNISQNATSYFWNFGDGNTSTAANPMHLYATSGPKTVTLIATNDCGSDTFVTTINLQITGISESDDGSFVEVYPNPGAGIFNLKAHGLEPGNYSIEVTNLQGQVIYSSSPTITGNGWNGQIDLSDLASGIYLMKWSGQQNSGTVRLIVR